MLQKNSFFSTPFIFYGSHQDNELEEDFTDEEWNFSDPWTITINPDLQSNHHSKIGLFILWAEPDDTQ